MNTLDFTRDEVWLSYYDSALVACAFPHDRLPANVRALVAENIEEFKGASWARIRRNGAEEEARADGLMGVAMCHYLRACAYGESLARSQKSAAQFRLAGFGQYLTAWSNSLMEGFEVGIPGIAQEFLAYHGHRLRPTMLKLRQGCSYVLDGG